MPKTTAQEFQRHIGRYQDLAQREPVEITRHGRRHLVLLSADEYERLKQRDRRAYAAGELPAELLRAVREEPHGAQAREARPAARLGGSVPLPPPALSMSMRTE